MFIGNVSLQVGSPEPYRQRVPVRLNRIWGVTEVVSERGCPRESTKPCLCRILFIDVLCTTFINKRLRGI